MRILRIRYKGLEPYQKRMLNSGVDGCELACGKIFWR